MVHYEFLGEQAKESTAKKYILSHTSDVTFYFLQSIKSNSFSCCSEGLFFVGLPLKGPPNLQCLLVNMVKLICTAENFVF